MKEIQEDKPEIKLTGKQKKFVHYYLIHLNATKAAKLAGYSEKTSRDIGSENLTKPNISAEIQRKLAEELGEKQDYLPNKLIREYEKIGFSDITKSKEQTAAIQQIDYKVIEHENGEVERIPTKIKMYNKTPALDSLAKYMGILNGETIINIKGENNLIAFLPPESGNGTGTI